MRGARSMSDLLDAQIALLGGQLAYLQAQKNLYLSGYRLLLDTGHLNAQTLGLPVTTYDASAYYEHNAHRVIGF
jgi:outer membrane protein TolC